MARFTDRLHEAVSSFNQDTALSLSREIHQAEMEGYILTSAEDLLWSILTGYIQESK